MSDPSVDAVLDPFFAAIEAGDHAAIAAAYAEDVEVWHNVTGTALDKAGSLRLLEHWCSKVDARRYQVHERHAFDGGVVQRHVAHGTVDGRPLAAEVAIVFHLRDGLITRIYEYLDPASVSAVFG